MALSKVQAAEAVGKSGWIVRDGLNIHGCFVEKDHSSNYLRIARSGVSGTARRPMWSHRNMAFLANSYGEPCPKLDTRFRKADTPCQRENLALGPSDHLGLGMLTLVAEPISRLVRILALHADEDWAQTQFCDPPLTGVTLWVPLHCICAVHA